MELKEIRKFIKQLIRESSKIIKSYFRIPIQVEEKSDHSPVTIADKKAEEIMRELIMHNFPDHGIHGEEFGQYQPQADFQWILDPIDGTKSFICGVPTFGTLIALVKNNQPIIGALNLPILNELLISDNKKTELNGEIVHFRECSELGSAILLTTDHLDIYRYQNGNKFEKLIKKIKLYRTWGDCFGYYLLATGYADIMIDPIMSVWDIMALIPIINGAGGVITDYQGGDPVSGNSILASNQTLHHKIISILND